MKKLLIPALGLLLCLAACTKEGPAGPAGASGANNVTTFTYTVPGSTWAHAGTYYFADIPAPAITQNILDSGSVNVFQVTNNGGIEVEQALPYSQPDQGSSIFSAELNQVQISIMQPAAAPGDIVFKIVIIKGL